MTIITEGIRLTTNLVNRIARVQKNMIARGENILDSTRQRKLYTRKWDDFIVY